MDSVEEHWARRAEKQAQQYIVVSENHYLSALLQNVSLAPIWNRGSGKGKRRQFHMTPTHVPQTLEIAILDLCRHQLAKQ